MIAKSLLTVAAVVVEGRHCAGAAEAARVPAGACASQIRVGAHSGRQRARNRHASAAVVLRPGGCRRDGPCKPSIARAARLERRPGAVTGAGHRRAGADVERQRHGGRDGAAATRHTRRCSL